WSGVAPPGQISRKPLNGCRQLLVLDIPEGTGPSRLHPASRQLPRIDRSASRGRAAAPHPADEAHSFEDRPKSYQVSDQVHSVLSLMPGFLHFTLDQYEL